MSTEQQSRDGPMSHAEPETTPPPATSSLSSAEVDAKSAHGAHRSRSRKHSSGAGRRHPHKKNPFSIKTALTVGIGIAVLAAGFSLAIIVSENRDLTQRLLNLKQELSEARAEFKEVEARIERRESEFADNRPRLVPGSWRIETGVVHALDQSILSTIVFTPSDAVEHPNALDYQILFKNQTSEPSSSKYRLTVLDALGTPIGISEGAATRNADIDGGQLAPGQSRFASGQVQLDVGSNPVYFILTLIP